MSLCLDDSEICVMEYSDLRIESISLKLDNFSTRLYILLSRDARNAILVIFT